MSSWYKTDLHRTFKRLQTKMYYRSLLYAIIFYAVGTYYLAGYYRNIWKTRKANEKKALNRADYFEQDYDTQVPKLFYHSPFHRGKFNSLSESSVGEITLVIVPCLGRLEASLNTMKSAIVLCSRPLRIVIYTEEYYVETLKETLKLWKTMANHSFTFDIFEVTYPNLVYTPNWRNLTIDRPCATQRIFLPSMLKRTDAILYVETDILFMSPVEEIWDLFSLMNSTQELAMVREPDFQRIVWLNETHTDPYHDVGALNSGIMLMNLTRMRANYWTRRIMQHYWDTGFGAPVNANLKDIIIIYLQHHPERLMELSPRYSFRIEYCNVSTLGYKDSIETGAYALHGTSQAFHNRSVFWTEIAKSWSMYKVGTEPYVNLYLRMKFFIGNLTESKYFMNMSTDSCHEVQHSILKRLAKLKWPLA